jgi:hypothetical protein
LAAIENDVVEFGNGCVISWAVYVCAGSNIDVSGFHVEMIVSEYTLYVHTRAHLFSFC